MKLLVCQWNVSRSISTNVPYAAEGAIIPTWTAVDKNNVKTSRELWESAKNDGWRVDVSVCLAVVKYDAKIFVQ